MSGLTRRAFLGGSGLGVAAVALGASRVLALDGPVAAGPFTLGVASGDPSADGFVLWTRLAPDPLVGGGMGSADVVVAWEVAADPGFASIVAQGSAVATAAYAHSVHVVVAGLPSGAWFWYRFRALGHTSPVGRARTVPGVESMDPLRFGFVSCQNYADGYYPAHHHLAGEGCDLVVHLGDYIYEGDDTGPVRSHGAGETFTLTEYRNRYALYKLDPQLQEAHQACPFVVTWDDHEVDNNYAGDVDSKGTDTATFLARRAAAYQAWWEHQPVRLAPPTGPDLPIHRTLRWGSLATFWVIDTRQHRDVQVCPRTGPGGLSPDCDERTDPARTLLGADQEAWLTQGVVASTTRFNVVANQMVFAPMPLSTFHNNDQWDGYPPQRDRVWAALRQANNPLVITGDIHAAGVADLNDTLGDTTTPVVGTELVGTSISSGFGDPAIAAAAESLLRALPWIHYADALDRGYTVVDLTPDGMTASFRVVSDVTTADATVTTDFTWATVAAQVGGPPPDSPVVPPPAPTPESPPASTGGPPTTAPPSSAGATGAAAPATPVPASPSLAG